MVTCTSCGGDVTGKKFCSQCGTAVVPTETSPVSGQFCPRCSEEVKPGAAFCMHCGASLHPQAAATSVRPQAPAIRLCPACNTQVTGATAFCTNCGHNLQSSPQVVSAAPSLQCSTCGRQNGSGVRFCGGCGSPLGVAAAQPDYTSSGQYQQPQSQYGQPAYPPQQYQQPQYTQSPYPQPYAQGNYQPQPMMGQPPMVLRCPTCMAMAPLGTPACLSCHTSFAGIVPTPANMPIQGQQGGLGGLMQGNAGKYAMGALGGAAAVVGGEMLLNGLVDNVENRVEGDMGYGGHHHHHHRHHRNEGLLGELGELADDIGL